MFCSAFSFRFGSERRCCCWVLRDVIRLETDVRLLQRVVLGSRELMSSCLCSFLDARAKGASMAPSVQATTADCAACYMGSRVLNVPPCLLPHLSEPPTPFTLCRNVSIRLVVLSPSSRVSTTAPGLLAATESTGSRRGFPTAPVASCPSDGSSAKVRASSQRPFPELPYLNRCSQDCGRYGSYGLTPRASSRAGGIVPRFSMCSALRETWRRNRLTGRRFTEEKEEEDEPPSQPSASALAALVACLAWARARGSPQSFAKGRAGAGGQTPAARPRGITLAQFNPQNTNKDKSRDVIEERRGRARQAGRHPYGRDRVGDAQSRWEASIPSSATSFDLKADPPR
ncbi:unnamed protein product [Prorocentrum cordatum]|uniref:Uncharacterized protein n=1 Tax=Prorocentrum cordatum TaxID=2364126 RepID=A0ABN9U1Y2_9DINO|nr:unnamed protein product [Polarella glacialis]